MKRTIFLFLLLAFSLTGCQAAAGPPAPGESISSPNSGESAPQSPGSDRDSRPHSIVTIPSAGESFFLTYWDGEHILEQFCYTKEDLAALAQTLSEVQGYITGDSPQIPKDPWPIYGLRISGTDKDFEAAYCGGIWLDSDGNVLHEPNVDFPDIWEQFAKDPHPRAASQPAVRELALCSGVWDPRFLREAEGENRSVLVPMELTVSDSGVNWTVTNQTGAEIITGNDSTAAPQILLDGVWYSVPTLSGAHYAWTSEACSTPPGETFSGIFWQAPYGPLPDGDYRLVLSLADQTVHAWTAAPFRVRNGTPMLAES